MNDTTNHYEYICQKCEQRCELRPTYLKDLLNSHPVRSLCCDAPVTPEVVSSRDWEPIPNPAPKTP